MLFNSFLFLVFFITVLIVYYSIPSWSYKKYFLLAASYIFYASWNPPFAILLLFSSIIDYSIGLKISSEQRQKYRRFLLIISCVINLGVLCFFKYANFLLSNYNWIVTSIGLPSFTYEHSLIYKIVLPIGISFYTLQAMSYTIDVYRRRLIAVKSWSDFLLFVSFFPQLVAGPIIRAEQFMPQLISKPGFPSYERITHAIYIIILGLFQKIVLADNLAPLVNYIFDSPLAFNSWQQWLGVYGFAFQIYFDFAGYSNIAIGTASLLGFDIPANFNVPYIAVGFRDYWKRWHISLSTWLRDYLYIPLGGNKCSKFKKYRNLIIVMSLGGLWHGASWSYFVWGFLHGLYLIAERILNPFYNILPERLRQNICAKLFLAILTFHLVCIAYVFFRLDNDITSALKMCWSMITISSSSIPNREMHLSVYIVIAMFFTAFAFLVKDKIKIPIWCYSVSCAIMLYIITVSWGDQNEFIYFQF